METRPPRQWIRFINQKKIYITSSRHLNYFLLFYIWNFTVKSVLIPLKHTFEYSDIKTTTSKQLEGFLMKIVLFISNFMTCTFRTQRFEKAHESKYQKKEKEKFWIYFLRSETGILSAIFLNIFECLSKISTLAIQQVFLSQLASFLNLLCCQAYRF